MNESFAKNDLQKKWVMSHMNESFAKNDLQLKASYESLPPLNVPCSFAQIIHK